MDTMQAGAQGIQLNGVGSSISDLPGLLFFDAVPGLSDTEIDNGSEVQMELTISNGVLFAEDWKDLYMLIKYEVTS
jgi:hypothetical protein